MWKITSAVIRASPGECLCILRGHTNPVRCIHLDNSRLVSGDYRGFVMIWDMQDIRDELAQFKMRKLKPLSETPAFLARALPALK